VIHKTFVFFFTGTPLELAPGDRIFRLYEWLNFAALRARNILYTYRNDTRERERQREKEREREREQFCSGLVQGQPFTLMANHHVREIQV